MEKSKLIYKTGNDYITNGSALIGKIRSDLDSYLLKKVEKIKSLQDNDLFISKKTEMGNEFQINKLEIHKDQFFILNPQFHSIDQDIKVIVDLSVNQLWNEGRTKRQVFKLLQEQHSYFKQ